MAISYRNSIKNSTNVRVNKEWRVEIFHGMMKWLWRLSPTLAKYLIRNVFFRPGRVKPTPRQIETLAKATPFSFNSMGKRIQCWKLGAGPSIVFIHGWAGRGIQFDVFFQPLINAGYSVIFFDAPGHGESEGRTSSYFEISNAVSDLVNTVDNLDVRAFVGHSLGGAGVINHLAGSRNRVKTVLIAPALDLIRMMNFTFTSYGVPLEIFYALIKDYEQMTNHVFVAENPIDLIQEVDSEALIIHDVNDKSTSFEDSRLVSLSKDNLKLHPTQGLGHIRILQDEQIADVVVEYIKPKILY